MTKKPCNIPGCGCQPEWTEAQAKQMTHKEIKTWRPWRYAGSTFRVFYDLEDCDFGPEMRVVVWSPIRREVIGISQEAMSWTQQAAMIIEGVL